MRLSLVPDESIVLDYAGTNLGGFAILLRERCGGQAEYQRVQSRAIWTG
jgi:hypothetical protein